MVANESVGNFEAVKLKGRNFFQSLFYFMNFMALNLCYKYPYFDMTHDLAPAQRFASDSLQDVPRGL